MDLELVGPPASIYVRTVRILLAEAGVEYKHTPSWPGEDGRPGHPFGLAPVLYVNSRPICESRAIALFIDRALGEARTPRDPFTEAIYEQAVLLLLTQILPTFTRFTQAAYFPETRGLEPAEADRLGADMQRRLAWIAREISPEGYLAQDRFGLADAYLLPILDYLFEIPGSRAMLPERVLDYRAAQAVRPSLAATRALL